MEEDPVVTLEYRFKGWELRTGVVPCVKVPDILRYVHHLRAEQDLQGRQAAIERVSTVSTWNSRDEPFQKTGSVPVVFLSCFIPGKLRPMRAFHRVGGRVAESRSLGSATQDHFHRHHGEVRLPECILLTRSVRIPLLAQGWLTATSPRPWNLLTQRSRCSTRSQMRSRASLAFMSIFTPSTSFAIPFGDEFLLRLDAKRMRRLSGSTQRRQPRHVLLDPLLWHGLEV